MNSVYSRLAATFTCILFLVGQNVLVDQIHAQDFVPIRGYVLDGMTKKALPNAKITLPKNRVTVADSDGKFEFSCLRKDSFMITAIGYCPRELSVEDLLSDSSKCNVFMQPFVYKLRTVQVTAAKKKSKVGKALKFLADVSHPINYFSEEETHKRKFAKIKANSVFFSENIYWEINRQLILDISKLSGGDLDKCIQYCNTHIVLAPNDDETSITNKLLLTISDYFKTTKSENSNSSN